VENLMLSWQQSSGLTAGLAVVAGGLWLATRPVEATLDTREAATTPAVAQARSASDAAGDANDGRTFVSRRIRWATSFLTEACIIAALYTIWQMAGQLSLMGTGDALRRGRWVDSFERTIHLPSERSVQDLILGHSWLVQLANLYYDVMHFAIIFVFLLWLFIRHRDRYSAIRTTLAITTLVCLAIQLIPVAPPRLVGGFVDTATQYGQSVYQGDLAGQLFAMPSVHVTWAVVVGWYAYRVSSSWWRLLGPAHAAITVFVVVATGNHWWLDGVVGVAVLIVCAWVRYGVARVWANRRAAIAESEPEPQPAPA
jgi:hypothetical protein